MTDSEEVWAQVAERCPKFFPLRVLFENHHPVREIALGGSVTWAGVHRRWQPAPGMRVMDIGANVGVFSAYSAVNGAHVEAYEPFSKAYKNLLALAYLVEPNLLVHRAAIWTISGQTPYLGTESRVEDCPALNGSIPTDGIAWNDADTPKIERVDMISFEEALGEYDWDFVKMDIEGAECEVLLATPDDALRRIKFMYLEFHPWVSEGLYLETLTKLQSIFHFEGAYFNHGINRWEAAYLSAR